MKRILAAYKDLLGIIYAEAPVMTVLVFVCSGIGGLLAPFRVYVNRNVFDVGLEVARGETSFASYSVFLALFAVCTIVPLFIGGFIYRYVAPHSVLIFRTAYKERMLKKIKTMKYEHFENEKSMEIIDKAYLWRTEDSARRLWPNFIDISLSCIIASIGTITYIASIRWWLLLTVLIPFIIETYIHSRTNYNIYNELETYWKRERKYNTLGWYLRSRNFMKETKAFGNSDFLIDTYQNRLNERNRDYEKYFFKHLRRILVGGNISRIAAIANVLIFLLLFINGQISVGLFISMSGLILNGLYNTLMGATAIFKQAPFHVNTYGYYDKFFNLSDESAGTETKLPDSYGIEFKDVWFRYPGTEKDILKGLSFEIKNGEKVSMVGENGEGKSTIVKLLLGLFSPDSGEILVGGKNLDEYPLSIRTKIFGPVFQDFSRFSITIKENIGVGGIDEIDNEEKIEIAAKKAKADEFAEKFEKKYDTLLGRDFDGGVDISGGQWQRIAIARSFMGDKPILLLDEPASQLDPMAEANLYNEFAKMIENKTAIFITHRLGSTLITDRILVISNGKVGESGTHDELMKTGGAYSKMFDSQKQWYTAGRLNSRQIIHPLSERPEGTYTKKREAGAANV